MDQQEKNLKSFSFKGNDVLGTIKKTNNHWGYTRCHYLSNPFDNEITIKVNAVKDQIVSILLYSLTGQKILDKRTVVSGENLLKIQPRLHQSVLTSNWNQWRR
jgi:hypothetical protein